MREFDYELIFKIKDDDDIEEYIDALYEAGCDDGMIGWGVKGRFSATFTREADSLSDAIISSIDNVTKAMPHAEFVEVRFYMPASEFLSYLG